MTQEESKSPLSPPHTDDRELFVVVNNPSNKNNLGTIIRCAVAFQCRAVIIVGAPRFSTHGAHGAQKHMPVVHFLSYSDAISRMRELGCRVLGIAATSTSFPNSQPVNTRRFQGSTAFVMGDQQYGESSPELASLCDGIVHVSFPAAPEVQALVHKDVKLSTTLHHFTAWANYEERVFEEHKYLTRHYGTERERQRVMNEQINLIRGTAATSAETNNVVEDSDDELTIGLADINDY